MIKSGAIKCLGKTFASEDERKDFFRNELRKKLPELKQIEGFPIGEDEDIIALSDPPYYTACPNPWLNDFVAEWEKEKETIPGRKKNFKVDEPYFRDISEGKNNPIYNVHTYHTKVPHPAIMRYILYYTQPGDIIFDGFAGTGMTGVASFLCGDPDKETKFKIENEWRTLNDSQPTWGRRKAICSDLSPIASFISYNYNAPLEVEKYNKIVSDILTELVKECGWLFQTKHTNGKVGIINYVVWSEVLTCPSCNREIVYFDEAVVRGKGIVLDDFKCPSCSKLVSKSSCDKKSVTLYDYDLEETITTVKYVPIFINYSYGGKRYEKKPDREDLSIIDKVNQTRNPYWVPKYAIPVGDKTGEPIRMGLRYVYQLYTKRNLYALSLIWNKLPLEMKWLATSFLSRNLTKCNRFIVNNHNPNGRINGPLTGTLYIPSEIVEQSAIQLFQDKAINFSWNMIGNINQVASATDLSNVSSNSIDYIFTDPPFGLNYMYSELNFIWESWLKVLTDNKDEAIENKTQQKSNVEYKDLMVNCFKEYYRVLKPKSWMTVEFSNTSATIWNAIQYSLQKAGFVLSNVAALDKVHGGIKSMRYTTSVKQDLIISCYKSSDKIENEIKSHAVNAWDFLQDHLEHLPIHIRKEQKTTAIIERSPKILYDRLISFYLMRGQPIPLDASDFQDGLKLRFLERDGMYFTPEQATEYDRQKALHGETEQLLLVFDIIYSENDAVQWLKERLRKKPQTYQDIMPEFRKANVVTRKGEREIELKTVLEENFIQEAGGYWRIPDMNEAKDREALRTKSLLKEFDRYITELSTAKTKKLKEVRVEALRAGFKSCWEKKDFQTIITIGDKIPQNLLLEDEQLLMFYDIAKDRV